ncbi:metallophosphoesterase [Metabacillus dongyingensis]|uniref:STAND family AAA ATPase n=1 Tax=Metabacillus dongyingensis TaxID=2874282 RepID=UPI003B8D9BBC
MKVGIIQLSDIHIKSNNDEIITKSSDICASVRNNIVHLDSIFICISGDVAYSGSLEEYIVSLDFLESIQNSLEEYTKKHIPIMVIPGNHDCDFSNEKEGSIRKLIMDNYLQNVWNPVELDNEKVQILTKVQENYFEFRNNLFYRLKDNILYDHPLLTRMKFEIDKKSIIFNLFNSSWFSELRERPGQMYYPSNHFDFEFDRETGSINVSLIHHPLHWLHPDNARPFKKMVEKNTDILLSGHEHDSTLTLVTHPNHYDTQHIEGAALQENGIENSHFNLIILDINEMSNKVIEFKWNGKLYSQISDSGWLSIKDKNITNSKLNLNNEFRNHLKNPGAPYRHPKKQEILLDDLYIYPDVKEILVSDGKQEVSNIKNIQTVFKEITKEEQWIIIGDKKSGKSTLCKILFRDFFEKGVFPILFNGNDISNTNIDRFRNKLKDKIEKQYSENQIEKYLQLNRNQKVLIIDDWHKCRLNTNHKNQLLESLHKEFEFIIITANELYNISEHFTHKIIENSEIAIKKFEIQEFGYSLRSDLINKWNLLGQEHFIEEEDLIKLNDKTENMMNSVIGKNYVPRYPFFLIVILQGLPIGAAEFQLRNSTNGFYYELIINQALTKIQVKNQEIDAIYNYIKHLAFYFFEQKIEEITVDDLRSFHVEFCKKFDLTHSFDEYVDKLCQASILEEHSGNYYVFMYPYIYYYFVALYLAHNIEKEEIKNKITIMCKKIYYDEFADILMFLTHLSKDSLILEQLLVVAKSIFEDVQEVRLENDVEALNELYKTIPELVLHNTEVKDNRSRILKEKDEIHNNNNNNFEQDKIWEYNFDENMDEQLDLLSQLNYGVKAIELIGQVLKNYYGSIEGPKKIELCEQAYFLGLRTLSVFIEKLVEDKDYLVIELKKVIEEKGIKDKEEVDTLAKKFLFKFSSMMSYSIIKKISSAVGAKNLSATYFKVTKENNWTSVRLIELSIQLDHFYEFPRNIPSLYNEINNNKMASDVLRHLVANYLYMFKISNSEKQRICDSVGISFKDIQIKELKRLEHETKK